MSDNYTIGIGRGINSKSDDLHMSRFFWGKDNYRQLVHSRKANAPREEGLGASKGRYILSTTLILTVGTIPVVPAIAVAKGVAPIAVVATPAIDA